jgi:hypothetical protein
MRHWSTVSVLAMVLLAGCAEKDTFWTRKGSGEEEFRRTSRSCNEKAQVQVFEEGSNGSCGYSTEQGSVCRRPDPNDIGQSENEKRRQERRRKYLYGECMQARGWVKNTEGQGYKGR